MIEVAICKYKVNLGVCITLKETMYLPRLAALSRGYRNFGSGLGGRIKLLCHGHSKFGSGPGGLTLTMALMASSLKFSA